LDQIIEKFQKLIRYFRMIKQGISDDNYLNN
jgi:hypothetical protein